MTKVDISYSQLKKNSFFNFTNSKPPNIFTIFADDEEKKPVVKKKGKRVTVKKGKKKKLKVRKAEKDEGGQGDAAE